MLTYNGNQSKTKDASLLTFSVTKLYRIGVFNLENPGGNNSKIDYLKQQYSGKALLRIAVTQSEYLTRNSCALGNCERSVYSKPYKHLYF